VNHECDRQTDGQTNILIANVLPHYGVRPKSGKTLFFVLPRPILHFFTLAFPYPNPTPKSLFYREAAPLQIRSLCSAQIFPVAGPGSQEFFETFKNQVFGGNAVFRFFARALRSTFTLFRSVKADQ